MIVPNALVSVVSAAPAAVAAGGSQASADEVLGLQPSTSGDGAASGSKNSSGGLGVEVPRHSDVAGSGGGAAGGGLKQQLQGLLGELGVDEELALPAAVKKASGVLGLGMGPLVVQVQQIAAATKRLRPRAERLVTELSLPSTLSLAHAIAEANKVLGLAQQGPLGAQLDKLYQVVGLS